MIFSPSTLGFYDPADKAEFLAAGSWPADGVSISDADWRTYTGNQPSGKTLGAVNGRPAWVDVPVGPKPTTVSAGDFYKRFLPTEAPAVFAACISNHDLGAALIQGVALGAIDLTSDAAKNFIDGLVAAGALTQDRATAILTP